MSSFVHIIWNTMKKHHQIMHIILAFSLMVVSSYIFVSETERSHLRRNAEDIIFKTEANIKSNMMEPETLLGSVSETIRGLILKDEGIEGINEYIWYINNYVQSATVQPITNVMGFYGIFDYYNGQFLNKSGEWLTPDNFDYLTYPWYSAAVNANGYIGVTQPYRYGGSDYIVTFARRIFSEDGYPLGIVCLDISLDRIRQYVVNTRFAEGGYGFLLNADMEITAHPEASLIGTLFEEHSTGIAKLSDELREKGFISEVTTTAYNNIKNIVFMHRLENDWYMGVVIPRSNYYQSTRYIAAILTLLGLISAILLSWMLLRINSQKLVSEERMKLMFKENIERARLLDTVNTAAAILLTSKEDASFESTLMQSFDLIGSCLDVDRVHLWRNIVVDGELHFVLHYRWLSDFGKTCKGLPIGFQSSYKATNGWEKMFRNGEHINSPISELSEDDREFLGYYEMKSIVIIPMFLNDEFWGFFSIDDCRHERIFSAVEMNIMSSAGLMISTAVDRNDQIQKMREVDERMQIMIDSAPLCAVFWDSKLNLIDCNQEALRLFGFSDKQKFLANFTNLSPEYQPDGIPSGEKGVKFVGKALDEGYSCFDWVHQRVDGEQIPAEIICVRVKYKNEFTVIEYIRDLREQLAVIAEMKKAEIAEESSKAKSDFLARMSHEIRTPMNAILGITDIQLQDNTIPFNVRDALERIYNSGDLLLGIINDILDLSKIEAGKLELVPTQYDIASLIHDTVQLNIMRYESKPIEFKLEVDENLPVFLVGDELRIKQILNNLLSNAFKYTDEGSVILLIYSKKEDKNDNDITLCFRVIDTGQGMTADQISKLGSEYSRFNMRANRKTEGTGLGMNITQNLIHLMNGGIDIESTPGVGSMFTVYLPQKCFDQELIGRDLANNLMQLNYANSVKIRTVQVKREFMPYGRVLVVDDVETNLYVARGLLAPYGLSIDTAVSGFEAIDKIKDNQVFHIIFMDHMMPKLDGIETVKILRGLGYTKPIVALTANALSGQAEMFLNNGFDDFISKPIDIRQLNIVLNKLIRDKMPAEIVEEARRQKQYHSERSGQHEVDSQLAEYFVRDAKRALGILESIYMNKCRGSDDVSMLIVNVHAMKSALANVGESDLSAEAARLEQAGRDRNKKEVMNYLPLFLEKLFVTIEKFEPKEKENSLTGDNAQLKNSLVKIKEACIEFDKKTAKNLLTELREKSWPVETGEWLSKLAGGLLHSDFEEVIKAVEEYLESA